MLFQPRSGTSPGPIGVASSLGRWPERHRESRLDFLLTARLDNCCAYLNGLVRNRSSEDTSGGSSIPTMEGRSSNTAVSSNRMGHVFFELRYDLFDERRVLRLGFGDSHF
jgi:hypothetical protein